MDADGSNLSSIDSFLPRTCSLGSMPIGRNDSALLTIKKTLGIAEVV